MADGIDSIQTDVLVIGSGAAGLIAAITARQNGSEVVVVSKAMTGGRTATALSDASLTVESPGFSQEDHFNKTMRTGHFLNDPDLVRQVVEQGPGIVQWLADEIGVEFEPLIDQGYKPKQGGLELTKKLRAKAEDLGIEKLEHLSLFKLLVYEGDCVGALGITSQGEKRAVFSKSTILATGGFSGIYPRQDNPKGQYGDGLALAMKAGAQVRDLEFVQFLMGIGEEELPTFLVFRPFPKEARLVNDEDEDVIDKYLPGVPLNEAMWSRRDELGRALAMENVEGTTYLDLTSVDWSDADRWFGLQHLSKFKFDYETRPLQVATLAHYTMGGVAIDERGRSSVPGLYAVGEVASGTHGANRHGGNSLMDCLVFGALAGEDVSAADRCSVRLPHELLAREFARFADEGGTFSTEAARQRLHAITDDYLEVLRDERGLYQARCDLRDLYRDLSAARTTDPQEAVGLIETEGATLVAAAVCEFALARTESRGAHYRKDYPEKSPLWQRSQFGMLQNGRMWLDMF